MEFVQTILVYLSLFIALAYLIRVWFWPQASFSGVKKTKRNCGDDSCGCS
ncbi:hypothetical protein [Aureicoccus marinus]|nr:hypothetical protein [Aureicoccus marinus]